MTLSPYRLDVNRTVRDRLGTRKASFAPAEETAALTGMQMGGVTVFGLPPGLPIWVDSRVMERERIVLGGGSRSWKVIAPPSILRALPGVEVVEGLANEPPPRRMTAPRVRIRPVEDDDLPIFLAHQDDPVAAAMAAFPTRAPDVFYAHWAKIRADPTNYHPDDRGG